jgi:stress response protein YsnF
MDLISIIKRYKVHFIVMSNELSINWDEVIKKEARGKNNEDLGEVQEIGDAYVLTQKGLVSKEKFYIPKYLVEGYDGDKLYFRVTEEEARNSFVRDSPPVSEEYSKYKTSDAPPDVETRIPVIEERLNVQKRESTREATITKEPVTEKKTVEVPVTHEEVSTQKRRGKGNKSTLRKGGSICEEKASETETRQVSEEVTSERVNVSHSSSTVEEE